jgi:glycosyltransferase involved in cell wall biosynthesis
LKPIKPKLSIIIPVLNNLKGLIKTIDSIKDQTFKDFDVWIIDGGSAKETQAYLSKLEAPFFYQSKKDKGIYDAMNTGISMSKGEWLFFLGAGDLVFSNYVLQIVFNNSSTINARLIAGKIIYEGVLNPFVYSKNKMTKVPFWSPFIWIVNGLHHQGTFYKRELFLNTNYNLKYKIISDYWFNIYLFKNKEKCFLTDETIAKCNSDGVSKSGNWSLYQEEIDLKTALSLPITRPFFYIIAAMKFLARKIIND